MTLNRVSATKVAGADMADANRQKILLVCGLPSSGTELLALVLSAHPKILIRGEFPLLAKLARDYCDGNRFELASKVALALRRVDVYGCLENANARFDATSRMIFGDVFSRLLTSGDYDWVGHKTPQNLENVPDLLKLFPRARVIALVRDPRDVAASWVRRWGKDPILLGHKWTSRYSVALQMLNALGDERYLVVRYEDLLNDLHSQIMRMCNFLNINVSDRMTRYHEFVGAVIPKKVNFGRPIDRERIGRYRSELGEHEQGRIEGICFNLLSRFGYAPEIATSETPITLWEKVRGRTKESFMLAVPGAGPAALSIREWTRRLQIELRKRL